MNINSHFEKMGARAKITPASERRRPQGINQRWGPGIPASDFLSLDIRHDKNGAFFDIRSGGNVNVKVIDVQPGQRHLVLQAESPEAGKSKYLCGHDERDWFVAAIPENQPVSSVATAIEALKPQVVKDAEKKTKIKRRKKNKRKNAAFIRQGEWFFLPRPDLKLDENLVLKKEPLRRGNVGKPHWAEECYRTGGQTVYVSYRHPNGMTERAYKKLSATQRKEQGPFQVQRRDPNVYVRGKIRHSDHKTIFLSCWHEVQMNTETQSRAMRNVRFID